MIHQKDVRLAYVSLVIVVVFISCHSVKWVPNMWELRQAEMDKVGQGHQLLLCNHIVLLQLDTEFPAFINRVAEVSHLLTVFNSSANLYIYLMKQHGRSSRSSGAESLNFHRMVRIQFLLTYICKSRLMLFMLNFNFCKNVSIFRLFYNVLSLWKSFCFGFFDRICSFHLMESKSFYFFFIWLPFQSEPIGVLETS